MSVLHLDYPMDLPSGKPCLSDFVAIQIWPETMRGEDHRLAARNLPRPIDHISRRHLQAQVSS